MSDLAGQRSMLALGLALKALFQIRRQRHGQLFELSRHAGLHFG
jgi:hypothetical protein